MGEAKLESAGLRPSFGGGPARANEHKAASQTAGEPVSRGMAPAVTGKRGEVAAIAEQVSRILARHLRVERERWGRTR